MNNVIRPIARRDYRGAIAFLESTHNSLSSNETTYLKAKTVETTENHSHHDITHNSYERYSSSFIVKIVRIMISYFSTSNICYDELSDSDIV
jgi:hypothetical protein